MLKLRRLSIQYLLRKVTISPLGGISEEDSTISSRGLTPLSVDGPLITVGKVTLVRLLRLPRVTAGSGSERGSD